MTINLSNFDDHHYNNAAAHIELAFADIKSSILDLAMGRSYYKEAVQILREAECEHELLREQLHKLSSFLPRLHYLNDDLEKYRKNINDVLESHHKVLLWMQSKFDELQGLYED